MVKRKVNKAISSSMDLNNEEESSSNPQQNRRIPQPRIRPDREGWVRQPRSIPLISRNNPLPPLPIPPSSPSSVVSSSSISIKQEEIDDRWRENHSVVSASSEGWVDQPIKKQKKEEEEITNSNTDIWRVIKLKEALREAPEEKVNSMIKHVIAKSRKDVGLDNGFVVVHLERMNTPLFDECWDMILKK